MEHRRRRPKQREVVRPAKTHEGSRFLCSELVWARWTDPSGREREETVNLEEIWTSGATLGFETPISEATALRFEGKGKEYRGRVTGCRADFIGYLVEVEFAPDCQWTRELYEPDHFFDPQSLATDDIDRKNNRLLKDCMRHLPSPPAEL